YRALYSNTTGSQNTANGANALNKNTTGSYDTANGMTALFSQRAERLVAIRERLERSGLLPQLVLIKPRAASIESLAKVHDPQYIDHIRQICRAGTGYADSPDTPASPDSYKVALMAVGGVQSAVDAVMEGRIDNAFCAVRPPGHHALKDRAMGFCFFNN